MNVLALYDIHGNADALAAVLADPRAANPDSVVVGGDAVPGPFPRAVLSLLQGIDVPVRWLRGNGEREVSEAAEAAEPSADADLAAITAGVIGEVEALALGALPPTIKLDAVLYCHATPDRDDELLTRLSTPERWAEALSEVTAALVVSGHTHQQDDRSVGSVRFVNAGSVGLPYEGDSAARWLWVADGVPSLRRTEYRAYDAGLRMLAAGWPDERSIQASLIKPVDALPGHRVRRPRSGFHSLVIDERTIA